MKNAKKIVMGGVAALALVTASVMGTMAYLQSQDNVTNTFTVGNDVKITLDEAKTDTLGEKVTPEERVKANSYKLMPGHFYAKDPTVHVDANSEDCYLFITVKDEITDIEKEPTVTTQITENGWAEVETLETGEKVYVYGTLNAPTKITKDSTRDYEVFGNFTVLDTTKIEDSNTDTLNLKNYENKNIVVNAYAIQSDGFEGKTASNIWSAINQ